MLSSEAPSRCCSRRYSMNESPYCGVNSMAKSRKEVAVSRLKQSEKGLRQMRAPSHQTCAQKTRTNPTKSPKKKPTSLVFPYVATPFLLCVQKECFENTKKNPKTKKNPNTPFLPHMWRPHFSHLPQM